mmetsp:Transcript_70746/g.140347  ORF Transcript_70746/g.140347 Transcript_70746/m.140347 type:complete len:190 (+) Transcript_70746:181-750(+)
MASFQHSSTSMVDPFESGTLPIAGSISEVFRTFIHFHIPLVQVHHRTRRTHSAPPQATSTSPARSPLHATMEVSSTDGPCARRELDADPYQNSGASNIGGHSGSEVADYGHIQETCSVDPSDTYFGEEMHCPGSCKPCAYFHKPERCRQGLRCKFCHLCPEGEAKRLRKENFSTKRRIRRNTRRGGGRS